MDKTAPLPSLHDQTPTWAKASALAREWELNRLADRLAELAAPRADSADPGPGRRQRRAEHDHRPGAGGPRGPNGGLADDSEPAHRPDDRCRTWQDQTGDL